MPDSKLMLSPLPLPLPPADPGLAAPVDTRHTAGWYLAVRPLLDFVLALALLVLTAPIILLAALLVKLTSRGPAFYSQVRVGKHGRLFVIFKLRTMIQDSESATGAVWASAGDPRITAVGSFLRASHIDEFPQLVNILIGQMSLIGPRPERPEIVQYLRSQIDRYTERLEVHPGISGLAQIHLPPDSDLDGVRRKLTCDLHYIRNVSFWNDLRLLICTGLLLFGVPLSFSRRVLRIANPLEGLPPR